MIASNDSKTFAAFISYRHSARDREWALRIFEALETYRVPWAVQKRGYPERLGKLFRDEDEIPASTDLSDQIKQALARSSVLVVICSPDTPKSRWIRREITLFQEMGKGDRIIPLLIAGEPEYSFPPELLRRKVQREPPDGTITEDWEDVEPVAADVRPRKGEAASKTFQRAKLRLAAAILGVSFDDLYQRERERARRAQQRTFAALTACLIALIGGGAWYWDGYLRTKVRYCMNYGERWGAPYCVGEIDEAAARQQQRVFRFSERAGLVREMSRLNGSLFPNAEPETAYSEEPWTRNAAQFAYSYNEQGWLSRVTHTSATGQLVREQLYRFAPDRRSGVVVFERDLGSAEQQEAEATGLGTIGMRDTRRRASIGQHRLTFDGAGFVLERRFEPLGGGGVTADSLGAYGRAYRTNALGLLESIRNLDAVGDTLLEKTGVADFRRTFDDMGRLREGSWLDKSGALTPNSKQFAVVGIVRDAFGRIVRCDYMDLDRKMTLRKDWGAARATWAYDARGNVIEEAYFGTDGKSTLRKDWGAARATYAYDARGNAIEQAYFGTDGKPTLRKDWGAARATYAYDARGNEIEQAYFGTDGKPTLRKDWGAARATYAYDARGNEIERAYFGTDGKPTLRKDWGTARATFAYDARGNVIEQAYFGTDGKPTLRKDWGAARVTLAYDARGNLTQVALFDTDGQPTLHEDWGAARLTLAYDARGNGIQVEMFGIDQQPALSKSLSAARVTSAYDVKGNIIEEAYFGVDGRPTLRKDWGAARVTNSYDARGNVIEKAYFGTDGKPTLRKDWGAARATFKYDTRGHIIARAFFDPDGQPTLHRDLGVARVAESYDVRGNLVETAYFGIDGRPSLRKNWEVARMTLSFDVRGREIWVEFYGVDGQPTLRKDWGAARVTSHYDARDNMIDRRFFGIDGQAAPHPVTGTTRIALAYDERGNITERTLFTSNDVAIYRFVSRYNLRDEPVNVFVFDASRTLTAITLPLLEAQTAVTANVRSEHLRVAGVARQIAAETEKLETEQVGKLGLATARALGNFAYKALFAEQPADALLAVERALALAPNKLWIETNQALAFMYLGRTDEARALFLRHRGKRIPENPNKPWEQVIVEGFNALRAAQLPHPLMAEIEAAYARPVDARPPPPDPTRAGEP